MDTLIVIVFVHQSYCLPSIVYCLVLTETVPRADDQAENEFKVFSACFEPHRSIRSEDEPSA